MSIYNLMKFLLEHPCDLGNLVDSLPNVLESRLNVFPPMFAVCGTVGAPLEDSELTRFGGLCWIRTPAPPARGWYVQQLTTCDRVSHW